jgi:hypothetical protein
MRLYFNSILYTQKNHATARKNYPLAKRRKHGSNRRFEIACRQTQTKTSRYVDSLSLSLSIDLPTVHSVTVASFLAPAINRNDGSMAFGVRSAEVSPQ